MSERWLDRTHIGDCRELMRAMAADGVCVQCAVTSPPYYGLRDYGVPGQYGLESSFVRHLARMRGTFRLVRELLAPDGVAWLNYGDSYAADSKWGGASGGLNVYKNNVSAANLRHRRYTGMKDKDMMGMPWALAFTLRSDGWWLRSDVIWCLSGGTWLYARTASGVGPAMLKDLVRLKPETVELWTGERWTRVTAWTRQQGRADAVELVLRSGERIGCTGGHIWPTARGDIRTDELRIGDEISTTKLPTSGEAAGWLTEDALWFGGLYLAEGSRSGNTIQIAGHTKETTRWPRIEALVAHYGGSARRYTKGNNESICVDSIGLDAVVRHLIAGRTAKDKHLAGRTWQLRDWALKRIAEGYLEGDGHAEPSRIRLGFCRNYTLERDLRCMGARLGAIVVINPCVAKNRTGSFPAFKGEWRWSRSGHHNERGLGRVVEIRRSRARQFWDVTVTDHPHLFALASGVVTHNSKRNPMPESMKDRPTKAHEHIFLLSKSPDYFYDQEATLEPVSPSTHARLAQNVAAQAGSARANGGTRAERPMKAVRRSGPEVAGWQSGPGAHSALEHAREKSAKDRGREEQGLRDSSKFGRGAGWRERKSDQAQERVKSNASFDEALVDVVEMRNPRTVWEADDDMELAAWLLEQDGGPALLERFLRESRAMKDVWTFSTEGFKAAHFATFPRELVRCCILAGSRPGDTVFDPFMGSGTVAEVALSLGRRFIGCELNAEYVALFDSHRSKQQGFSL